MTETRNNYQDVHDVTQLEMSLTLGVSNYIKCTFPLVNLVSINYFIVTLDYN